MLTTCNYLKNNFCILSSFILYLFLSSYILSLIHACSPTEPNSNNQNYDLSQYRIYAAYEGNLNHGILIFDPVEFTILDSIILDGVPLTIKISMDSKFLYVNQMLHPAPFQIKGQVLQIDIKEKQIVQHWDKPSTFSEISNDERYFFVSEIDTFLVFDRIANKVVFSVKDSLRINSMVADPLKPGVYASFKYSDSAPGTDGIFHFNAKTNAIDRNYQLVNEPDPRGISPADMAITHDGNLLFLTNNVGGGIWPESYLHVINLKIGEQIAREFITGDAQLAVTTDDRYVYITDPGVPLNETARPLGILRRYDIVTGIVENYIDFKLYNITPTFNGWPMIYKIALFPNNKTCVVSSWETGADLMIWDLVNKELLGKIGLGRGYHTQVVRSIVIGKALAD